MVDANNPTNQIFIVADDVVMTSYLSS